MGKHHVDNMLSQLAPLPDELFIYGSRSQNLVRRPNSNFANKELGWGHHDLHIGIDLVTPSS